MTLSRAYGGVNQILGEALVNVSTVVGGFSGLRSLVSANTVGVLYSKEVLTVVCSTLARSKEESDAGKSVFQIYLLVH